MTIFSAGGGGDGGSAAVEAQLAWQREQQAQEELDKKREAERSKTQTDYRRGELQDRPGYSGLTMVGPAVGLSDETLAAQMAVLPVDDSQRQAYEQSLVDEQASTAEAQRIITGEQYKAEDAFRDVVDKLDTNADEQDIQAAIGQINKLKDQYAYYDPSQELETLNKKLAAAQKRGAQNAATQAAQLAAAQSNQGA